MFWEWYECSVKWDYEDINVYNIQMSEKGWQILRWNSLKYIWNNESVDIICKWEYLFKLRI